MERVHCFDRSHSVVRCNIVKQFDSSHGVDNIATSRNQAVVMSAANIFNLDHYLAHANDNVIVILSSIDIMNSIMPMPLLL